jgi:hypothetical protein
MMKEMVVMKDEGGGDAVDGDGPGPACFLVDYS